MKLYSEILQRDASRDIVQFVDYEKQCANSKNLLESAMEEIPEQLASFYKSKGIKAVRRRLPSM